MKNVQKCLEEMMIESGAYLKGHFLLTSGKHSGHYMQCAMLLRHPDKAEFAGREIAKKLDGRNIDFVVSPAIGGLIIGHEVARALGVPFIFCERDSENNMKLRRFPLPDDKRFVVVEDVITTGGSAAEVGKHMTELGAQWVDTACIVNRSGGKHVFEKDPVSLWETSFPVYEADECPLCADGSVPYKPGSRKS